MKLWLVMGSVGEYGDNSEWPVKVFADEAKAKALVVAASERASEIYSKARGDDDSYDLQYTKGANEHDPDCCRHCDYSGPAHYSLWEIDADL